MQQREEEEAKDAELCFWDPPYYQKKIEEYGPNSISALTRDEYLNTFKNNHGLTIQSDKYTEDSLTCLGL